MANSVRHVLFYDSGDLSLAAEHFPAHQARYQEFMRSGVLLTLGPFSDRGGSMAIFSTREAAEEFASADQFSTQRRSQQLRNPANGAYAVYAACSSFSRPTGHRAATPHACPCGRTNQSPDAPRGLLLASRRSRGLP